MTRIEPAKPFNLRKFIDKIELKKDMLVHLAETEARLAGLLNILINLNKDKQHLYGVSSLYNEYRHSFGIEGKRFNSSDIETNFFIDDEISHDKIIDINNYAIRKAGDEEYNGYRKKIAWVSGVENGKEIIRWYAPEAEDVEAFMEQFIEIYKNGIIVDGLKNPILESALIHFIFMRIHPFKDGNGRTARMLYNIKFTNCINQFCGTDFKFCPLNLSNSILLNKPTYVARINAVNFDLESDNNGAINGWFDFILDMIDEQINYFYNMYPKLIETDEHFDYGDFYKPKQK